MSQAPRDVPSRQARGQVGLSVDGSEGPLVGGAFEDGARLGEERPGSFRPLKVGQGPGCAGGRCVSGLAAWAGLGRRVQAGTARWVLRGAGAGGPPRGPERGSAHVPSVRCRRGQNSSPWSESTDSRTEPGSLPLLLPDEGHLHLPSVSPSFPGETSLTSGHVAPPSLDRVWGAEPRTR